MRNGSAPPFSFSSFFHLAAWVVWSTFLRRTILLPENIKLSGNDTCNTGFRREKENRWVWSAAVNNRIEEFSDNESNGESANKISSECEQNDELTLSGELGKLFWSNRKRASKTWSKIEDRVFKVKADWKFVILVTSFLLSVVSCVSIWMKTTVSKSFTNTRSHAKIQRWIFSLLII